MFGALPALAARLLEGGGLRLHLTGSGSACFALLPESGDEAGALAVVRVAWGAAAFATVARLG